MLPDDYLELATQLAVAGATRPKQALLRRAVSTAYYALFHHAARTMADALVGRQAGARKSAPWIQMYRALEHRRARDVCASFVLVSQFPDGIREFANMFMTLQDKRHAADYKPNLVLSKSAVQQDVRSGANALRAYNAESMKDRQAFSVLLLLGKPRAE